MSETRRPTSRGWNGDVSREGREGLDGVLGVVIGKSNTVIGRTLLSSAKKSSWLLLGTEPRLCSEMCRMIMPELASSLSSGDSGSSPRTAQA